MIIGNGLIARSFRDNLVDSFPICIFASGVSNSKCIDDKEFEKEKEKLLTTIKDLNQNIPLIYFSTCSVYDSEQSQSKYVQHKKEMEDIVANLNKFYIFRLPQLVGFSENRYTLTNFIKNSILEESPITIYSKAKRNLIDIEDVVKLTIFLIKKRNFSNSIINIASPIEIKVTELVFLMEKILNKKAIYFLSDNGSSYTIDVSLVREYSKKANVYFEKDYVKNILLKYYSNYQIKSDVINS